MIKIEGSGTVLFVQKRIGKDFKPFPLYKFRTMIVYASQSGPCVTVGDDPRVTRIGKFLRKAKIDELPQLVNVLRGDMSFVGPRPEVKKYVEIFKDEYGEILKVRPGMTDYAAIEFRDEEGVLKKYVDYEEEYIKEIMPRKIELYKQYIKGRSFFVDIKLILLTLYRIMR